jgi:uncharacterized protein YdeI (BOF family)
LTQLVTTQDTAYKASKAVTISGGKATKLKTYSATRMTVHTVLDRVHKTEVQLETEVTESISKNINQFLDSLLTFKISDKTKRRNINISPASTVQQPGR